MKRLYTLLYMLPVLLLFSCGGTKEIKDGNVAYNLKKYQLAAQLLQSDYAKAEGPEKANIAFKIAKSYKAYNATEQAEQWYKTAFDEGYDIEALYQYAKMLQTNQKYDKAIAVFERLIREEPFKRAEYQSEIAASEAAKNSLNGESFTVIENLSINSSFSEFGPVLFENNGLIFTSNRSEAQGEEKDLWTGNPYYDLFLTERNSATTFTHPQPFSPAINTGMHEGTITYNANFTEAYFTYCGNDQRDQTAFCSIFYSRQLPDGGWSEPEIVPLFDDSLNVGHPFLSPDGQMLVYSAVDPMGFGGSDIYYSVQNFEGWSAPINAGRTINTEGDEAFPYLDKKGNLYFASNGRAGMGGFDVFLAEGNNGTWINPRNLGHPINSPSDDFGILILPLNQQEAQTIELMGYISSSREGGKGGDDIYFFQRNKPPGQYRLVVDVLKKDYADPDDPDSEITGESPLQGAELEFAVGGSDEESEIVTTDATGRVVFEVDRDQTFHLFASKEPDYFSRSAAANTIGKTAKPGDTAVVYATIVLDKVFKGKEIVIPNIYYDFTKWDIREDAAAVIDTSILKLMRENPNIIVELGSHTDSRGTAQSNLELSRKRAQSAVDYLVSKGIERERLKAIGYGESQLVNNCTDGVECTEEEHQRNRRTTFKVVGDDFQVESEEPEDIIVDPK